MNRSPNHFAATLIIALAVPLLIVVPMLLVEPPSVSAQSPKAPNQGTRVTDTPTSVPTDTATSVPTDTPTTKPTKVPTDTPTKVPTKTPTQVPTKTPTQAPTKEPKTTVAPTRTSTPTSTITPTSTDTLTPTRTPTRTRTRTPTPTVTPTASPSASPTATASATNTATSTDTPTETATSLPTLTPLPTDTPTPFGVGEAVSPTPTPTPTNTPSGIGLGAGGGIQAVVLNGLAGFNSNYFIQTIHGPENLFSVGLGQVLPNLLLAIILAIIFGFFANLLSNESEIHNRYIQEHWLAPVRGMFNRLEGVSNALDAQLGRRGGRWIGDVIKVLLVLIVYGFFFSLLDPAFDLISTAFLPTATPSILAIASHASSAFHGGVEFELSLNATAILLLLAVTFSVGLVSIADDVAKLIYMRRLGANAVIRVHGGNFVFALVSVLFSRVATLTPGIVFGNPGGLEGEEKGDRNRINLVGIGTVSLVALVAWLVLGVVPHADISGAPLWLATILALVFAIGIQTLFFEMIPVSGLYGREIYHYNRLVWLVGFVVILFLFLQTQLNPDGSFVSAFNKPNMIVLAVFVLAFSAFSAAVWIYFRGKDQETEA